MAEKRAVSLFAAICAFCIAGIVSIVISSRMQMSAVTDEANTANPQLHQQTLADRLYFRHTAIGPDYGRLAFLEPGSEVTQFHPSLSCEAVHASGGRGLCLSADRGVFTTYTAFAFDTETHQVLGEFELGGSPSRTRVSSDGRFAASTVFVTGHGYDSVDFSTQTMLYDLETMEPIADLETFTVLQDGEEISREDFNFWGVTFPQDSGSFFATLSTDGAHYLVKGETASRTATVIHENVECPSVSPDGTHIAFKRRKPKLGGVEWGIHVLRLADGAEVALAEERSIDDQLEWLDGENVLYSVPDQSTPAVINVWSGRADGDGDVRLFLSGAYSPAVMR